MDRDEVLAAAYRDRKQDQSQPAASSPQADYADAWKRDSYLNDATSAWNGFKKDHPNIALIASVAPVTGTITSALDLNDAYNRGDKAGMAAAAAGMIPSVSLITKGAKSVRAGMAMERAAQTAAEQQAARAVKRAGAARAAGGATAGAMSASQNLGDYVESWKSHADD